MCGKMIRFDFACFPNSVRLNAYANIATKANSLLTIKPYTSFDAKFNADFEFEVRNLCLPTHLKENRILKHLRRRIQKIQCALNPY